MSNYNFTDKTANGLEIEINNPHTFSETMEEDRNVIYSSSNASNNKAVIINLENNRYAALKPIKNKYFKLKEIVQSFSHKKIGDMIMKKIIVDDIDHNE